MGKQRRNSAAARRSSIPEEWSESIASAHSVCAFIGRSLRPAAYATCRNATRSRGDRQYSPTFPSEGDAAERARQAGSPVEERGVHVPQEGRPAGATKLLGHRVELPRRQHAGGGAERRSQGAAAAAEERLASC